jgi:hypothetical protein
MMVYEVIKDNFFVGAITVDENKLTLLEGAELHDLFMGLRELQGIPLSGKESGGLFRLYLTRRVGSKNKVVFFVKKWLEGNGYSMTGGF